MLQSVIRAIYPSQCIGCEEQTASDYGLCGACWSATQFITGTICDCCGAPLMGEDFGNLLRCDDCMTLARPWSKGRAAIVYAGKGRSLVLGLKHRDRTELAIPAARWITQKAEGIITPAHLLVPVPLHWSRLLKRRYNQAVLLTSAMAKLTGLAHCPDALIRTRRTKVMENHSRAERFAALDGAIDVHPRRQHVLAGRRIALVDDVMTTGATLAACADRLLAAGASDVCVLTLARAVKEA